MYLKNISKISNIVALFSKFGSPLHSIQRRLNFYFELNTHPTVTDEKNTLAVLQYKNCNCSKIHKP